MKLNELTSKELEILNLINDSREEPIQWDLMPKQEVYVHLYGWDNPHVDINLLLTPKEKSIILNAGYDINNNLKRDVAFLKRVRRIRKNP
jgi:hypothetical protein